LPIYEESNGDDGFCSIEVSPLLAKDTEGTIKEAVRLYNALRRPNIMVKVPGTKEGIPAVYSLLEQGINVNITLLFSVDNYEQVANIYCEALNSRIRQGLPVDTLRSVASFFVSRVDTSIDLLLNDIINKFKDTDPAKVEKAKNCLGKFGIANSRLAYKRYQAIFEGASFSKLRQSGAVAQRPLWASTGVKNPDYRDVLYVEELIGRNTVNTMPQHTLEAFIEHGIVEQDTILKNIKEAEQMPKMLKDLGIDTEKILYDLQVDGVKKFSDSFLALNETIKKKL
jgi:transaldolase